MSGSNQISRREFVTITVGTLGTIMVAAVGIPAIGYALGPSLKASKVDAWIPVGKVDDFPTGIPTLVNFTRTKVNGWEKTVNSYGVYVVKPASSDIYVLSNVCTHLSCRVNWTEEQKVYLCPCHDGHFDIEGQVVSGPPPSPLDRYETKVEDGTLYIHLQEG
jgi:menaquinol-cytochrome c reductase iron-sulfur subunit